VWSELANNDPFIISPGSPVDVAGEQVIPPPAAGADTTGYNSAPKTTTFSVPGLGSVTYDEATGVFRNGDPSTGNAIVAYAKSPQPGVELSFFNSGPVSQSVLSAYSAHQQLQKDPSKSVQYTDITGSRYMIGGDGTATGAGPTASQAQTGQQTTAAQTQTDAQFQQYLAGLNLPADQKAALNAIYQAVGSNDQAYADKIKSAMSAATAYSDPYFKAQVNLVTDALSRGLQQKDGDLAFQEKQLSNSLGDLVQNIASSKDMLAFDKVQQLKALQQNYEQSLEGTRTNLAALGKTSSSVRSRSDELQGENYNGMLESTNKTFNFKTDSLNSQQAQASRDTALQIENLQRLTTAGKIDLLRNTENQIGSSALGALGQSEVLGGVGGQIPRAQTQDALSFASQFVF